MIPKRDNCFFCCLPASKSSSELNFGCLGLITFRSPSLFVFLLEKKIKLRENQILIKGASVF